MIPKVFREVIDLGDGRTISLETGKLAKQAHGSVVVQMGKAMLLCTVVSNYKQSPVDFLPLTVDYREKFAAAGRYPGGFFKREARPSDGEVLTMRLVDRVLRPLFPKDYHSEVQVMIQLMSHDEDVMPDALAGLAASAAIQLSDFPFECPISEARVARVNGEFVINPNRAQLAESDIDMMIGASADSVMMVEGEMDEISEEEMAEAIKFAHESIKIQCAAQVRLAEAFGKKETREYEGEREDADLAAKIHDFCYDKCYAIAKKGTSKVERTTAFGEVKEELKASFSEEELAEYGDLVGKYFNKAQKSAVRELTLAEGLRLDGRKTDEIRPIWCEVDYLPSVHGSSVFTRGETQALVTATLGTQRDAQRLDTLMGDKTDPFMLHYNFPPYCVGETGFVGSPKRREIGHGRLAKRGMLAVMPSLEEFPYAVRVVSEITESNGSSSMASVCGTSLALMDAGVPIKASVAGIAMGLVKEGEKFVVLSDILGDEDHLGDMDFKVAGTTGGITALQMDIKIEGITQEIMQIALNQAKAARTHILSVMDEAIGGHRTEISEFAPRIHTMKVSQDKIRDIIGKGGATIRQLTEETGTTIEIEDDGTVKIAATSGEQAEDAINRIKALTAEIEVGTLYTGKVVRIVDFGAFVNVLPGKDGLVHISQISEERVNNVSEVLTEGQEVKVKVLEVDRQGRVRLSIKEAMEKPAAEATPAAE
jgi:polyribonucleotide nucleotidyltransferase